MNLIVNILGSFIQLHFIYSISYINADIDVSEVRVNVESHTSISVEYEHDTFDLVYHDPEDSGVTKDGNVDEDAVLNFTQLVHKYGYECEEYDVITEDNYILKLFHIKGDTNKLVLVTHAFFDSADSYILRGNKSLAINLAKKGYDAWYLNVRGNKYSRRHVTLNPDTDNAFWDFSFHEFGVKDLPAAIDFVLNKTNQSQLSLIGFSQGTQICFILTSMKCEYNSKVKIIIALAPVAFLHNIPPPTSYLKLLLPAIKTYCLDTGTEELFRSDSFVDIVNKYFCSKQINLTEICETEFIFPLAGPDPSELEPEFIEIVLSHFPTSTSRKNLEHMVQLQFRQNFSLYDYGLMGNVEHYGSIESPIYPLDKITAPVALLVGPNDRLSCIADVVLLRDRLQNVFYHVLKRKDMNHFDFVWAKDMDHFLFPLLFDLLKNHPKIFNDGC